jgi:hypothetical protein
MPSPTTQDLLDAMADQIREAVVLVTDIDIQVEPYWIADPSPPTIDMYPGDVARGTEAQAFGTDGEFLFTVRVRVPANDPVENQATLNALMDDVDPLSVAAALEDEPTLGGLAMSLDIDAATVTGLTLYQYGSESLPGRQFTCRVIRGDS